MSIVVRSNFSIVPLYDSFDVYFLSQKSLIFIKGLYGIGIIRLPKYYFFILDKYRINFMFNNKYFFSSFLGHFLSLNRNLNIFFFAKIKLRGLGYRIRPMTKKLLRIFMGFTNYIFFHVPENIFIKSRRRRMIIITNDLSKLRTLLANFFLLKNLSPYRLRGVFFPKQIILMKPGKKRF